MFCPNCGAKNVDEARFCAECGQKLPQTAAAPESPAPAPAAPKPADPAPVAPKIAAPAASGRRGRCKYCGKTVFVGANPCPHCGHELKWTRPAAGTPAASPAAALRSHLAEQVRNKPVQEVKPVSSKWLWCLAVVAAVLPLNVLFLWLDQREIKHSGRKGDGLLWYFLLLGVPAVACLFSLMVAAIAYLVVVPAYLFATRKETRRNAGPGVLCLFLNLACIGLVVFALTSGPSESDIRRTAKEVLNEQILPRLDVSAKCISVDELSERGDDKWKATATLKTADGRIFEVPLKVKRKEGDLVLVEINAEKLADDDPVLFRMLFGKTLENMDESDFDL